MTNLRGRVARLETRLPTRRYAHRVFRLIREADESDESAWLRTYPGEPSPADDPDVLIITRVIVDPQPKEIGIPT